MKTFTKVMLFLAGIFATVGVICIVVAFAMGLTTKDVAKMFRDGDFSIRMEDGELKVFGFEDSIIIEEDLFEKDEFDEIDGMEPSTEADGEIEIYEIEEVCQNIDLEFGAGVLDIYYDDVEHIVVKATDIDDISVGAKNGTLKIGFIGDANIEVDDADSRKLEIVIPSAMQFKEVDMEIGAGQALVKDLMTDELSVSVGAGQATFEQLAVNQLDVEAGIGQVSFFINGTQEEYNYNVECGIGSVKIGDASYGGFAAEDSVKRDGATKEIHVECGVGEVTILFQNII